MSGTATAALATADPAPRSRSVARDASLTVALLLLPLLLGPLPLASVAAGPRAWLATALLVATAAVLLRALRLGRTLPLPAVVVPALLFVILAFLQLLPLGALDTARAAGILDGHVPTTLTLLPLRTLPRAMELLAALAVFVAAALLLPRTSRATAVGATLVALGAGLSLYGLLMQRGVLPPVDAEQPHDVLVATYFNRNHFAGLLEMAILTGLGVFAVRLHRRAAPSGQALLGTGIAACLLGLVATESRGGLLGLLCGAALFLLLAPIRQRRWAFVALAAAAVLALWLVPDTLVARLQHVGIELGARGSRPDIWRSTVTLWLAFPWFGTGLGTYADVSATTQLPHLGGHLEHAHSDPLELLAETGVVGMALLLVAMGLFFWRALRKRRCQGDRDHAFLAAGATAAVAAICVHGLADFNLQIPANVAWFALLAGMAAGLHGGHRRLTLQRPLLVAATASCCVAALFTGQRAWSGAADQPMQLVRAGEAQLQHAPQQAADLARVALQHNPFLPAAHRLLGEALTRLGQPGAVAAFAQCLHWSDPEIRQRRQFELAVASLTAGDLAAAQRWLQPLFAVAPKQWPKLLERLYASAPAYELLALLVPPGPRELRLSLAELLLRHGDFGGRERELAHLRGDVEPAMLTIADGVLLRQCERSDAVDGDARTTRLLLTFAVAETAVLPKVRIHCRGADAGLWRPVVPANTPTEVLLRFDASFPPGDYDLLLDCRAAAPLPLGRVTVPREPLAVAADQLLPMAQLYWSTRDPDQRRRVAIGVRLQHGDRLWRDVQLPDTAAALVLQGAGAGGLRVAFADQALVRQSATDSPVQSFALPRQRSGLLRIENTGERDVTVKQIFVTAGRQD